MYDAEDRVDHDDSEEKEEEDDDEQAVQTEKTDLNKVFSSLQSAYHLLEEHTRPIAIEINIEDDEWMFSEDSQYDYEGDDELSISDLERGFINILETIRKPVYDLMHGATSHEVKVFHGRRQLDELFHLDKEKWSKEENTHKQKWGPYTPETNYVPQSSLCIDQNYVDEFTKRLPKLRKRWGYGSFRDLLRGDAKGSDPEV
jgi:hypothetical protein